MDVGNDNADLDDVNAPQASPEAMEMVNSSASKIKQTVQRHKMKTVLMVIFAIICIVGSILLILYFTKSGPFDEFAAEMPVKTKKCLKPETLMAECGLEAAKDFDTIERGVDRLIIKEVYGIVTAPTENMLFSEIHAHGPLAEADLDHGVVPK